MGPFNAFKEIKMMTKSNRQRGFQGSWVVLGVLGALTPFLGAEANTREISQLLQVCKADSRKPPTAACTDCHTNSSGKTLNANGQLFKTNLGSNDELIRTTFCPDKNSGPVVREKPILMVVTPLSFTAGSMGMATFSATDPQGARLSLTVKGLPKGAKFKQTGAVDGVYGGVLTFTPTTKQVRSAPYRLTVTAKQLVGSPKLSSSATVELSVVNP